MKLLVSDYDGTIKTFDNNPNMLENYVFNKNINAIKKFVNKDNKFVIATGRNTDSIYNETNKYEILYNYLLSYNGRVIVDRDKNILNAEYIDPEFIKELDSIKINKLSFYDENGKNNSADKIIYIYLTLYNIKKIKEFILEKSQKYPDLEINYNFTTNNIVIRKKYNKLIGINKLIELENIDVKKENIITVGDEANDVEMLDYYKGYRMFLSNPKLIFTTKNQTTTIYKLIKKIQ